jgi:hypothetical protein
MDVQLRADGDGSSQQHCRAASFRGYACPSFRGGGPVTALRQVPTIQVLDCLPMQLARLDLEPRIEPPPATEQLSTFHRRVEPKDRQFHCGHCGESIQPMNFLPSIPRLDQDASNQAVVWRFEDQQTRQRSLRTFRHSPLLC